MREAKERIEQLKLEEQEATRKGDYNRAAQIQYGEMPQLEAEVKKLGAAMDGKQSRMLKEEVDEEDVAKIVSKWTGIPVSKMLEGEVKKLVTMEDRLRQRVIGQDEAIRAWPMPFGVRAPDSAIRGGRSARSSSWARPASAKPSWRARWRSFSSTMSTP